MSQPKKKIDLSFLLTIVVTFVNVARLVVEKHKNWRSEDEYEVEHLCDQFRASGIRFPMVVKEANPGSKKGKLVVMCGNREALALQLMADKHPLDFDRLCKEGVGVKIHNPADEQEEYEIRSDHNLQKDLDPGAIIRQMKSHLETGYTYKQVLKEFALKLKAYFQTDAGKNGTFQTFQVILAPVVVVTQFILFKTKQQAKMVAQFKTEDFRKIGAAQAKADEWDDAGWSAEALAIWNKVIAQKDGIRSADKDVRDKAVAEAAGEQTEKPTFDAKVQSTKMKSKIMKQILGCIQRCDLGTLYKIDEEFAQAEANKVKAVA